MMFLTTRTETEALLLEQNLIKQLKPRYNVLLRDDKSFPNIMISVADTFPLISKHRGKRDDRVSYFGPFASAAAVNRTLNQLQKAFLLRSCSDPVFQGRVRPCLLFQIKRCAGPCAGKISAEDYRKLVAEAIEFLRGKSTKIQSELAEQMREAAQKLEFERAAALRDRIRSLTQIQSVQGVNPQSFSDADLIALHVEGGQACVQVFFYRAGLNWGNHAYYPATGSGAGNEEILEAFVVQFYTTKPPPKLLILSRPPPDVKLLEDLLRERAGHKVHLQIPVRGEKATFVENAVRNAREALAMKMAEVATQGRLLAELAEWLDLEEPPARIEVFDNSHIQGSHAVGVMIVVGREGFLKSAYRKFNFRSRDLSPGDDYGMMREMLTRRFDRLVKEDPERGSELWPDLLLLDGGKGQVSAAVEVLGDLGISDLAVLGMAKGADRNAGREVFHRPAGGPLSLDRKSPVLYFLQRIRDESHRFAVGSHRARRAKGTRSSQLDSIPGIGAARKSALLAHFGSARAVMGADPRDLQLVRGISKRMSEVIYRHFRDS